MFLLPWRFTKLVDLFFFVGDRRLMCLPRPRVFSLGVIIPSVIGEEQVYINHCRNSSTNKTHGLLSINSAIPNNGLDEHTVFKQPVSSVNYTD